jgi:hypothetical protein
MAVEYVTRRQGVLHVRERLGIPLTLGRVNKDTMQGRGPKPVGKYGPATVYTIEEFERYARERLVAA